MSRSSHSKTLTGGIGLKDTVLLNALEDSSDSLRSDDGADESVLELLARAKTRSCVEVVSSILEGEEPARTRLDAARLLVEWGWGKGGVASGKQLLQSHGITVQVMNLSAEHRVLEEKKQTLDQAVDVVKILGTPEP